MVESEAERVTSEVRSALDAARKQLLDLTFRNNFLNYRILKARGIEVVADDAVRVAEVFDSGGATVRFISPQEADEQLREWQGKAFGTVPPVHAIGEVGDDAPPTDDVRSTDLLPATGPSLRLGQNDRTLITAHEGEELDRRLLATMKTANSLIEERGVNTLFLVLGTLRWTESSSSHVFRTSPLCLIPVKLERFGGPHGVAMRYEGEDRQGNPTLRERLAQDGVVVPELDDELDLKVYLDAVEAAVSPKSGWEVDRSHVSLGFFSFTRYLMYLDLDADTWPEEAAATQHHVVRALLRDGFAQEPFALDDAMRLDEQPAYDAVHHVLEADGSQTTAVVESFSSDALVIQGPPGTGKSQTIANLLAEAVVRGKRVLFVAEKRAALDVVWRRLAEVGLGSAALQLHSDKATRSAVVKELSDTLRSGASSALRSAPNTDQLRKVRQQLNAYADAVHEPIGDSGVSPYELFGRARQYADLEPLDIATIGFQANTLPNRAQVDRLLDVAKELDAWSEQYGRPSEHPYRHVGIDVALPSLERSWQGAVSSALAAVDDVIALADAQVCQDFGWSPANLHGVSRLVGVIRKVASLLSSLEGADLSNGVWVVAADELRAGAGAAKAAEGIYSTGSAVVAPTSWAVAEGDPTTVDTVHAGLTHRRDLLYRWFSGRYREALRTARTWSTPGVSVNHRTAVQVVETIRSYVSHVREFSVVRGTWLRALPGDGDVLSAGRVSDEVLGLVELLAGEVEWLNPAKVAALGRLGKSSLEEAAGSLEVAVETAEAAVRELFHRVSLDAKRMFGSENLLDVPVTAIRELLSAWNNNPSGLLAGVSWHRITDQASQVGAGSLIQQLEQGVTHPGDLRQRILHAAESAWIDEAFRTRPALAAFAAHDHQLRIDEFRTLDAAVLSVNRQIIGAKHREGLPKLTGTGAMGVLAQEFKKKRRHRPIRKLMSEAGTAIQAIKPIFMMSPLSVAVYLPRGAISFDMVIFDEASQIRPADALGAILRGRQTIVVGDDRQLPPTTFFDAVLEEREADDETFDVSDVESILGLFGARAAKQVMLNWHYRSKHESLIAVSNQEFYDNRLMLFPSPDVERANAGVILHHLENAAYDKGNSRTNRIEAREVAQAVLNHAKIRPQKTLGVATFGRAQAEAVDVEIEAMAKEHPVLADFRARHPLEPFFVKNLETVQGDERDVIFVSIGYGKDANGVLSYNFGPLNQAGGERRLNVLVTRARERTEVFSNFTDEDLDPSRTTSQGLHALRKYLAFARTGRLEHPEVAARDDESPFEDAVAHALRDRGHHVLRQVGQAGYFVDLAITDPDRTGSIILGIECDGAAYHSSRSARERDRLRQAVLEGLGWTIHRIWSTDWFRDPVACLERVEAAIRDARTESVNERGSKRRSVASRTSLGPIPRELPPDRESDLSTRPITAEPYRMASFAPIRLRTEFHEARTSDVLQWLVDVVQVEEPIHRDDAYERVIRRAGLQRLGSRIRAKLREAEKAGQRSRRLLVHKDDSLTIAGFDTSRVQPRDRSKLDAKAKDFGRVPWIEIEAAVIEVVRDSYGMRDEEVGPAVARLLGFGRATDAIQKAIWARVEKLLGGGRLVRPPGTEGTLRVAD